MIIIAVIMIQNKEIYYKLIKFDFSKLFINYFCVHHYYYSTIVTAIVYPISTHWCWAKDGWLKVRGFRDFAGSGVVHLSGGIHALVGKQIRII